MNKTEPNGMRVLAQKWMFVDQCPACGSQIHLRASPLSAKEYVFDRENIPLPDNGISVAECANCRLVYKTVVPSTHFLAEVFTRHAGTVWNSPYEFNSEVEKIKQLLPQGFDLLDIGPSDGGLLKACSMCEGRRSGLDIVKQPGLDECLRGEFINGLIEDSNLAWSGDPYDIVSLFDVFEHLYRPENAFANLVAFVKAGGYLIIETGDTESFLPKRHGIHEWWYANLFEHYVFWNRLSIRAMAEKYGFKVISMQSKRHKQLASVSLARQIFSLVKSIAYEVSPKVYKWLMANTGRPTLQPWNPLSKDHLFVVLQRVNS